MKKLQNILITLLGLVAAFVIGMYAFEYKEVIADVLGIRTIANSPGNNATSSIQILRYVANGATTTLPAQISGVAANGNGFTVADAESITFAYQTVGSSSPYTARFHVEYGYEVPNGTSTDPVLIQWFTRNYITSGENVGYNASSTLTSISASELSSTTPLLYRSNLGMATTSEIFEIPTLNAKYMRIHAAAFGSNAMFWLNAIIRDYKR